MDGRRVASSPPDDVALAARRVAEARLGGQDVAVILTARCERRGHLLAEVTATRDDRGVTTWVRWPRVWEPELTLAQMRELSEPLTYSGTSHWAVCGCPGRYLPSHIVLVDALAAGLNTVTL